MELDTVNQHKNQQGSKIGILRKSILSCMFEIVLPSLFARPYLQAVMILEEPKIAFSDCLTGTKPKDQGHDG